MTLIDHYSNDVKSPARGYAAGTGQLSGPEIQFPFSLDESTSSGGASNFVLTRTEELHDWPQHTADAQIEHVSPSGTGAVQFVVYDDEHLAKREDLRSADGFHVLDNAAMIAAIRSDLSLQVTEIAEVVGVQRPTIYSWVKGSSVPQRPNRKRLFWLYELACRWRKLSLRPVGAAIRDAAVNGQSLVDMLRDPNADEASILTVFREIAQRQAQQEDQRKPSMREIAEAHGFPTEPRADAQDRIDIITGKRFGLE